MPDTTTAASPRAGKKMKGTTLALIVGGVGLGAFLLISMLSKRGGSKNGTAARGPRGFTGAAGGRGPRGAPGPRGRRGAETGQSYEEIDQMFREWQGA